MNPDDVVGRYGADAMRLFEMFMGPLEEMKPWSTNGVEGVFRFLNRVWRLFVDDDDRLDAPDHSRSAAAPELERVFHATVRKVGEDIEGLRFNTAISQLMIFVNEMMKAEQRPRAMLESFVLLLAPFAPHVAEELWSRLGHTTSLAHEPWPVFDPAKIATSTVEIVLQVNGKVRVEDGRGHGGHGRCRTAGGSALADETVRRNIEGKQVVRVIIVKNKLVNIVVR